MNGRQHLALPVEQRAAYWNAAARSQGLNAAERLLQTPDRDLQTEFLRLLRTLARPVATN